MPNFSNPPGQTPIYHVARNQAQRQREEPNARVGDTEWGICNKYNITYAKFREWNGLPPKEIQSTITIEVGRKYIVGFKAAPVVNPTPTPKPQPVQPPVIIQPPVVKPTPKPPVTPTPAPPPVTNNRRWPQELRSSPPLIDYMKSWERPPLVNGQITGRVFRDTKGGLTIGYGHFIPENEKGKWRDYDPEQGGTRELTMAEMEDLFRRDVDLLAEVEIRKRFTVRLLQQEYDALVDFTFHRGGGALRESGLEGYINSVPNGNFNYDIIKDCFMKYAFWFNQATQQWEFLEGFKKRRQEEINMFQFGIYTLHS